MRDALQRFWPIAVFVGGAATVSWVGGWWAGLAFVLGFGASVGFGVALVRHNHKIDRALRAWFARQRQVPTDAGRPYDWEVDR